ncbi:ATPase [Actinomycetota bacterium]|nr:ATPase [Actinomycetota bacterium]
MALTEQGYKDRLIDSLVVELLETFGAVSIEGPKFCGKTWTALNHAESVFYAMDPDGNFANRQLAQLNPSKVIQGESPRLIDEWQVAPGLWDAVRFAVDRQQEKGRYILTGSTTPAKDKPIHSGAGRIARVFLRPLTLFESGESSGEVSLRSLFDRQIIDPATSSNDLEALAYLCIKGGWPENQSVAPNLVARMPAQYLESVYTSDISNSDGIARDSKKVAALVRALARNNGTMVSNSTLKQDVAQREGMISTPTLASYLVQLKRIFVLEELGGWAPNIRAKKRARTSPKRYLVDPSLVTAALGASAQRLLSDMPTFGQIFEGLCIRDLLVYSSLFDATIHHYHDEDGVEVDAIVELKSGEYGAIEIKLNAGHENLAAEQLALFKNKMRKKGAELPKFSLIITGGGLAYQRDDGIFVVPITCLRD